MVRVVAILDVDLDAVAELAGVLVKGRFEPAFAQAATGEPVGRQGVHSGQQRASIEVGGAEEFERAGGAAPFGERRAFEHHRAGVATRHRQVGCVRAGVDPGPLAERPAEAGAGFGLPVAHGNDLPVEVELQRAHEPAGELAQGEAVAHRQRAGADETLPARAQGQPFDRPARGVRTVEDIDALAVRGGGFEHVAQGGDEGVDAAAEVLQVDQQDVESLHHRRGRPPDFAVEAEDRDAVDGVEVIGGFDHVVLLVAAQPVLRPEGGAEAEVGAGGERVEGVREVGADAGRMGEQGEALAGESVA